ncbi:hypothetical protein Tco_1480184 [Tanacetum coccineum]
MSDSEDSTVTYTEISSPFKDLSDIGSPGVDGPPVMPEDPYAYAMATFQAPPSPDYLRSSHCLLLSHLLPTHQDTFTDSDPEEDPEEYPTDYPADGGDDDDDDDESSDDDEDDDDDIEEDEDEDEEEEEEEHPAPADSVPPPAYRTTARMSIRDQSPTPFWSEAEVDRLLAIRTPPPSILTPLSSPLPQLPSPPLPVSSPLPVSPPPLPASPTHPLGYRAAMIRLRAESPSTSHSLPLPPPIILSCTRSDAPPLGTPPSGTPPLLPISAPTSSPPLLLPSTDHREDKLEVCLPPRKRLCIALGPRYEIRESLYAPAARSTKVLLQTMVLLPLWIGRLGEIQREDTDEIYGRLDEAQEARVVLSGRLNLPGKDKRSHAYTALLMEREAKLSREA